MRKELRILVLAAGVQGVFLAAALAGADDITAVAPEQVTLSVQPNQSLTVNAYLGMVNGEPLFVENILQPIDTDLQRLARLARSVADFRTTAHDVIEKQFQHQIEDILLTKSAKEGLTEDDSKRIDAIMNKVTKDLLTKYQGSAAKADQDLRARGSSLEKNLADQRRGLISSLYRHKILDPKIVVTRRMIMDEYQRNIKDYTVPDEVDLYTITLSISKYLTQPPAAASASHTDEKPVPIANPTSEQIKEATDRTIAQANDLISQIKKGAEFSDLARDYSTDFKKKLGGRWPHTRKGMLASEEIEKTAFSLPTNGIAEPIVVSNPDDPVQARVVIVKVGDVTQSRVIPFEEAQTDIKKRLEERQWLTLNEEYFRKIQEKASIEGVDRMVDTVTDAAVTRYLVK